MDMPDVSKGALGPLGRGGTQVATTPEEGKGPPEASSQGVTSRGFVGLFSGLDLPNLIQMLAMNNFSGRVEIRHKEKSGELFFNNGNVVHASAEREEGVDALERMLAWTEGEVLLDARSSSSKSTIEIPWHALLIQAMARLEDKKAALEPREQETFPRSRSSAEILRARALHSSLLKLRGVKSCLIGEEATGELVCPASGPASIRELFWELAGLCRTLEEIRPEASGGPPGRISLILGARGWGLARLEQYLVAVELEKGTAWEGLEKKIREMWEKGQ